MDDALSLGSVPSGSSSPLSEVPSRSPTPPSELNYLPTFNYPSREYPSPLLSSSDLSSLGSTPTPMLDTTSYLDLAAMRTPRSTQSEDDSPSQPPKKRRRIMKTEDARNAKKEKKEKTEDGSEEGGPLHLDLTSSKVDDDEREQYDKLMKVLHKRRKIVVVAGAGISVSAGIPDFRSSTGLFKTLKREHNLKSSGKDLFDAAVYKDGDSTTSFHAMIRNLSTATKTAAPTPFHHLLATLAQENRLLRLYTQNVDGIDTSLPPLATQIPLPKKGPWPKTVQLHGTLEHMTCTKCHRISDFDPDLFDGPSPPACRHCEETDGIRTQHAGKRSHGIGVLRPRMVLYNEHNPDDEAIGSVVKADLRTRPDALIVVGTTLKVPGVKRIVKEMCGIVRDRKDGVTVWINNDPPPALKDYEWDLVVKGPCDSVATYANMRKWDEPELELLLVSDDQVEKVKRENGTPQVVVLSPSKKNKTVERVAGVITPAASPKMKSISMARMPAAANANANTKATKGAAKKQSTLGTKRKQEDTSASGALKKALGKKSTAPKKKNASNTSKAKAGPAQQSGIKLKFNVAKPNTQPIAIKPDPSKPLLDEPANPARHANGAAHAVAVEIPTHTQLQPLSPASARNNGSPPYYPPPMMNPIGIRIPQKTPAYRDVRKSYPGLRPGAGLTVNTTPTKESPEERKRVVTPPSVPNGMRDLFS